MSSMASLPRKRVRNLHSLEQVGAVTGVTEAMEQVLSLVEKARSFHSCKTLATDVAKTDTRKHRTVKALDAVCRGCGKKGHFEKVCLKAKHSTHSLEVPQASTSSTGAGASEPLYFDNDKQPSVCTHGECSSCKKTFNQVSHSIGLYNTEEPERKLHYTSSDCVAQGRHRGQC